MKAKVESMEDELSRLVLNINKISASSERINGTLQEKREQIEQLSGVHHLLQKVILINFNFLFSFRTLFSPPFPHFPSPTLFLCTRIAV